MATGLSTQSELWPSACRVELPSKPHSGSCSRVGNELNSLIWVWPPRFGVGDYPSSQIYSSLYFVIELSHVGDAKGAGTETLLVATHVPGRRRPLLTKQLKCQPLHRGVVAKTGKSSAAGLKAEIFGCDKAARLPSPAKPRKARFRPGIRLITQQQAVRTSPGLKPRQPSANFAANAGHARQPW